MISPTIVWLRRDLRLKDNPALCAAAARGGAVIPVYIWTPGEEAPWAPGGAGKWWLHHSLAALAKSLAKLKIPLVIRRGGALAALRQVISETGASAVHWNRLYDPHTIPRDTAVKAALRGDGIEAESHASALLFEPHLVEKQAGGPFQVFTPFWKQIQSLDDPPEPLAIPALKRHTAPVESLALEDLKLLSPIDWAGGMRAAWRPGEEGSTEQLARFVSAAIDGYAENRNRPDIAGTSRLSPYLHFGEITPRAIWHFTKAAIHRSSKAEARASAWAFLRELGWREFNHHLLYHFPTTDRLPLRKDFERFPWREDAVALRAWQRGQTGYPIVDAGMRELWTTGWMHNRVRMIVASFLVKHLLIHWQEGAAWFWDTLVDADLANNSAGWQWVSGCGADAAPYFRVFNPITQGEKFDPEGDYTRRWVPELAGLPTRNLFAPFDAPATELGGAGVVLGTDYPKPIVDHREGRERALDAFATIRSRH